MRLTRVCALIAVSAWACGTLQPADGTTPDGGGGPNEAGPSSPPPPPPTKKDGGACDPSAKLVDKGPVDWLGADPRAMRIGKDNIVYAAVPSAGKITLFSGPMTPAGGPITDDGHLAAAQFVAQDNEHPAPLEGGFNVVFESNGDARLGYTALWIAARSPAVGDDHRVAKHIDIVDYDDAAKDPYVVRVGATDRLYFVRMNGQRDEIYAGDLDVDAPSPKVTSTESQMPNATQSAKRPVVSNDELEMFFSYDTAGDGDYDIYRVTRTISTQPFPSAAESFVHVAGGATKKSADEPTYLTDDRCDLYVLLGEDGSKTLHRLSRR